MYFLLLLEEWERLVTKRRHVLFGVLQSSLEGGNLLFLPQNSTEGHPGKWLSHRQRKPVYSPQQVTAMTAISIHLVLIYTLPFHSQRLPQDDLHIKDQQYKTQLYKNNIYQ